MIILENVSKYYPTKFGRNYVLRDVSITLPRDRNIGILGVNGAGKSTLLRLLGGMDMPSGKTDVTVVYLGSGAKRRFSGQHDRA
jgi:ABC-type methionine transport system ATPase subunit